MAKRVKFIQGDLLKVKNGREGTRFVKDQIVRVIGIVERHMWIDRININDRDNFFSVDSDRFTLYHRSKLGKLFYGD